MMVGSYRLTGGNGDYPGLRLSIYAGLRPGPGSCAGFLEELALDRGFEVVELSLSLLYRGSHELLGY